MRQDVEDRFWQSIIVVENCWEWAKKVSKQNGYAHMKVDGRDRLAHRWAYEHFRGPIPDGMQIDHLCRNRSCVNPEHMEVVSPYTNTARGFSPSVVTKQIGFCKRGHEMVGDNIGKRKDGRRWCKACVEWNHEKNRDHRRAYFAAWRLRNMDKVAGYQLAKKLRKMGVQ